jgi:hypothetical protein
MRTIHLAGHSVPETIGPQAAGVAPLLAVIKLNINQGRDSLQAAGLRAHVGAIDEELARIHPKECSSRKINCGQTLSCEWSAGAICRHTAPCPASGKPADSQDVMVLR